MAWEAWASGTEKLNELTQKSVDLKIENPETLIPSDKSINRKIILARDMFQIVEPKKVETTEAEPETKPISDVPLTLLGTFVESSGGSTAIIENTKEKSQEVFGEGQNIFETAKLVRVEPNRVIISRNGTEEILELDDGPASGGGASSGDVDETFQVSEDELNQALDNLPLLLTQARAVPYFKDGKAIGLRLFAIRTGSLYEKAGLKNGDILREINGQSLADISQAAKLFEKLRDERSLNLKLERNREPKTFGYSIR
jgi:general secretion pathway protein C